MKSSSLPLISTKRARFRFELLEDIFQQIGAEQSRIILMSYRGDDINDIAQNLDIPEPLAHQQLTEAQQRVRQLIKKYYA